ncbi:SRPBCC family protein [Streptomyces sp. NPDC058623]|uniref:SRPBCC family protein n=1 Tax=Streptomyces sp. NPDC058623 TaxID=3346563 RepID=UPI003651C870
MREEIRIEASPESVYDTVTDLGRSAEWSVECTGGTWVSGEPRTVGAVFRGDNVRGTEAVAWAPVIRGNWRTESEVVEADPGRAFRWVIRNSAGGKQDSVWSFEIEPAGDGCVLVHGYRLGRLTEGLAKIFEGLSPEEQKRFVVDWNAKLAADVAITLRRIKDAVERN